MTRRLSLVLLLAGCPSEAPEPSPAPKPADAELAASSSIDAKPPPSTAASADETFASWGYRWVRLDMSQEAFRAACVAQGEEATEVLPGQVRCSGLGAPTFLGEVRFVEALYTQGRLESASIVVTSSFDEVVRRMGKRYPDSKLRTTASGPVSVHYVDRSAPSGQLLAITIHRLSSGPTQVVLQTRR